MHKFIGLYVLLVLSACGFTPVYAPTAFDGGTSSKTQVSLSSVAVRPLPERMGQQLRNRLFDAGFSDNGTGMYVLDVVDIQTNEFDMGVSPDNTATRRMMTVSASLVLVKDNEEVLRRPIVARATYNVLISQYGTIVASDSAVRQIVDDLARQIETQTMLALGQAK